MKKAIFAIAICIGSAVSAHAVDQSSGAATKSSDSYQQNESAIQQRMGQLQLNMLIASIADADEHADAGSAHSQQAVASIAR